MGEEGVGAGEGEESSSGWASEPAAGFPLEELAERESSSKRHMRPVAAAWTSCQCWAASSSMAEKNSTGVRRRQLFPCCGGFSADCMHFPYILTFYVATNSLSVLIHVALKVAVDCWPQKRRNAY